MNNQLITMTRTTAVEPTYVVYSLLNEDVVRAGIIQALEVLKASSNRWSELTETAKFFHLHMEQYLNDELTALFHGTFIDLEVTRKQDGMERYRNAAK